MKATKRLAPFISLLMLLSSNAYGQQAAPPQAAYTACEGKSAGDAAELVGPNGQKVKGTCSELEGKLVLRPFTPIGKSDVRKGAPPQAAYTACEGKSAGDAAEFTGPRGDKVKGKCAEVGGKLVLQPDRPKGKAKGGPPAEAYTACQGKSAGDTAQFTGPKGATVSGTCKEVDGKLVLQPDRPKANK